MRTPGLEIERKYRLRSAPSLDALRREGAVPQRIEQVYLRPAPGTDVRRVRRIEREDGSVEHVLTGKAAVGRGTIARREREVDIDEATYDALRAEAEADTRPIRKTRWVVPHGEQELEIDVFEEPPGLVVVEVELASEDEPVTLPAWLGPWREVTDDARYLNAELARRGALVPDWDQDAGGPVERVT
jgi:CYTH domain-containing protein